MRVSGGESVCPPLAPALIRADGKMGGALHCGWMGGGGDSVLAERWEERGLSAFSPPSGVPQPNSGHPTQDTHWTA